MNKIDTPNRRARRSTAPTDAQIDAALAAFWTRWDERFAADGIPQQGGRMRDRPEIAELVHDCMRAALVAARIQ